MGKSRRLGFLDYQPTDDAFRDLFGRLRADRLIPHVGDDLDRPAEIRVGVPGRGETLEPRLGEAVPLRGTRTSTW
jgi:hypothetical protein